MTDEILSLGINTGNSLDAADVVLTKFSADGSIEDLDALSEPMPLKLVEALRVFRTTVMECSADMKKAEHVYQQRSGNLDSNLQSMDKLITSYTLYVAEAVKQLIKHWQQKKGSKTAIDLIGFHGQTCAHQPPSMLAETSYTVQIGNGQLLANETGIPVVFDLRSDDLMNGGEAAPLAPVHHEHLAVRLKNQGKFPIAFCNAGNTGNISVISQGGSLITLGWDSGPFNEYPDKLMQKVRHSACDLNGAIGSTGKINADLLRLLFDKGAVTGSGDNFLLQPPPKSSDPQWYRLLPELLDQKSALSNISFEDKLRTCEYFSTYIFYYSLKWIPNDLPMPAYFALCGGGWDNPVSRIHFEQLLKGNFDNQFILPDHKEIFVAINKRFAHPPEVALSDQFGFSGKFMEARLFADAAVCRIKGIPFTRPQTTGCRTPTVLGIIRFPQQSEQQKVKDWLKKYKSVNLTLDNPKIFDSRWSRASAGWTDHCKQVVIDRH